MMRDYRVDVLAALSQMVNKAGVKELLTCWSQEQEELREFFPLILRGVVNLGKASLTRNMKVGLPVLCRDCVLVAET